MTITRQQRVIAASDTGSFCDTGPPVFGRFCQLMWQVTQADTGCDLQLFAQPREADTGDGFLLFSRTDFLGADRQRNPMKLASHDDGYDTGRVIETQPVLAGERVRVRIIP